jgi:hypothetical protein
MNVSHSVDFIVGGFVVRNLARQRAAIAVTREIATISGARSAACTTQDAPRDGGVLTRAVAGGAQVGEVRVSRAETICLSDGTRITFAAARVQLEAELA